MTWRSGHTQSVAPSSCTPGKQSVVTAADIVCEAPSAPISKEHQAVKVEIHPDVRVVAAQLGDDVPYALKALAGQLVDDPDMGDPSELPGILTVTVDGGMFDDCPNLVVGYVREPDRIEIRFLKAVSLTGPDAGTDAQDEPRHDRGRPATPVIALTVRQVADAWHRITSWLQSNAPDSYAALRAGASPADVAAVEDELGIQVPAELRTLWLLTAGDEGVNRSGCMPGNQALMTLDAVTAVYRLQMEFQAHEDTLNARRRASDRVTVWKPTWIPVVAYSADDSTSGLYLDTATGYLDRWSRYNDLPGDERDTLVTYLEGIADMLEAPALASRDKPGLIGGELVWGSKLDPSQERHWQALTG